MKATSIWEKQTVASLQVNNKSLMAESRIIRDKIRKTKSTWVKSFLHEHRVKDVRQESRIVQLTLAAVTGTPYNKVEPNAKTEPNWPKIMKKIDRHTIEHNVKRKVGDWCMEGERYYKSRSQA